MTKKLHVAFGAGQVGSILAQSLLATGLSFYGLPLKRAYLVKNLASPWARPMLAIIPPNTPGL
ncbi:MAG: hypothetical protein ACRELG_00605 [Gemmataceae bacterium]